MEEARVVDGEEKMSEIELDMGPDVEVALVKEARIVSVSKFVVVGPGVPSTNDVDVVVVINGDMLMLDTLTVAAVDVAIDIDIVVVVVVAVVVVAATELLLFPNGLGTTHEVDSVGCAVTNVVEVLVVSIITVVTYLPSSQNVFVVRKPCNVELDALDLASSSTSSSKSSGSATPP